ncbi:MAG: hypothetical protein L3J23_00820 [Flavobacteriaceae bacterium]|nr:hypothetical protein [Flavobacteriaceae bacterium]
MKTHTFILLLLCCFVTVKSQNINQLDTNNKRHGIWKKKFNNDRIRYQGTFDHGKEIGVFKFYAAASSDHPTIIKEFNTNDNTAIVKFYSETGVLKSNGKMDGKKRIGKWVYYHKDGKTIMQEENYINNELNGDYKTFFPSKKPAILTTYNKGKIHGNYKRYSINNSIYQELTYVNGKLEGKAIYYDRKTGKITEEGQYKNDEKVGDWKIYIDGEFSHSQEIVKKKVKQ